MSDPTTLHYQVTGASGFVGSHVVDELLRQGYSVRGYAYILSLDTTQYTYGLMTVVSAVRSHNVARISKSYESFGDRFTTTVIDDIATSDLSQAVKVCITPISYLLLEAECILGVDAIIHVASPLSNSAAPQVILDVRGAHTWFKFSYFL